jgi:hypothetical protein
LFVEEDYRPPFSSKLKFGYRPVPLSEKKISLAIEQYPFPPKAVLLDSRL